LAKQFWVDKAIRKAEFILERIKKRKHAQAGLAQGTPAPPLTSAARI
jgi:hypothetical protein